MVLPVLEETKVQSNLTPTVPSAVLDTRPSIFDLRKQKKQGSFRATSYDKLVRNKALQRISEGSDDAHVLGELLICLFTGEKMLSFHSDFELCQGY